MKEAQSPGDCGSVRNQCAKAIDRDGVLGMQSAEGLRVMTVPRLIPSPHEYFCAGAVDRKTTKRWKSLGRRSTCGGDEEFTAGVFIFHALILIRTNRSRLYKRARNDDLTSVRLMSAD